jgi:hypothetical protein
VDHGRAAGYLDGHGMGKRDDNGKGIHGNMNKEHREQTMMDDGHKETSAIR